MLELLAERSRSAIINHISGFADISVQDEKGLLGLISRVYWC
jgi:hypothetical protein